MGLLKWALVFLVLSVIAGILGFGNMAEGFGDVAKVLFFLFLAIFAVLGIMSYTAVKAVT